MRDDLKLATRGLTQSGEPSSRETAFIENILVRAASSSAVSLTENPVRASNDHHHHDHYDHYDHY